MRVQDEVFARYQQLAGWANADGLTSNSKYEILVDPQFKNKIYVKGMLSVNSTRADQASVY